MTHTPQYPITNTRDAATQIGVTVATIINMVRRGDLTGYQTGAQGKWMVYQSSIDKLKGVM